MKLLSCVVALFLTPISVGIAAAACIGDCNRDGRIGIDEVLRGVNILLGEAALDTCYQADANCDGAVALDEVVAAVDGALHVCRYPARSTARFHFDIAERVDFEGHGEPQMTLGVATTEIFGSCGWGIAHRVAVEDRAIRVSLGAVVPPVGPVCLATLPAGFTAPLALSDGAYELELASSTGVDRYSVSVTERSVQLRTQEATFSQPDDCVTRRVPRFAIVAQCFRYHYGGEAPNTTIDELCPLFFADIEAIAQPLAEGDGTAIGGYCGADDFAAGTCRLYR